MGTQVLPKVSQRRLLQLSLRQSEPSTQTSSLGSKHPTVQRATSPLSCSRSWCGSGSSTCETNFHLNKGATTKHSSPSHRVPTQWDLFGEPLRWSFDSTIWHCYRVNSEAGTRLSI